mgnify:CR=1 FL=1
MLTEAIVHPDHTPGWTAPAVWLPDASAHTRQGPAKATTAERGSTFVGFVKEDGGESVDAGARGRVGAVSAVA